ncbi:MAG: hypothetical protein JWP81_2250 [Ferruginibacter sp.]|nr:hypothetical protein [Ferruginibacter sp.]
MNWNGTFAAESMYIFWPGERNAIKLRWRRTLVQKIAIQQCKQ